MDKKSLENLSFNDMPKAVAFLVEQVTLINKQIEEISKNFGYVVPDQWMSIDDLTTYLPDKPSVRTIYGWVGQKLIPYNKVGKRLYFLKSDVDHWLKNGRRKTAAEIAIDACERYEKESTSEKK